MTATLTEKIVKASAVVAPGEDDDDSPHGTFNVILSTPTKDRDGEEVKADEWELPLPEHITFDVDHGMSVASTVGSGVPTIDDDGRMVVAGRYASTPLAQTTRALVREGHIRTTSVAFLRRSSSDSKTGRRTTRELLNGAFVAVPANREALVLDSKAIDADLAAKVGARNSTRDQEHIQTAHDHTVAAGATCMPAKGIARKDDTEDADAPDTDTLTQAVDAALDEACALFDGTDTSTLPDDIQQAIALVQAAGVSVDELLDALNLSDPDEDDQAPPDNQTVIAAATAIDQAAATAHAARMRQMHLAALRATHDYT